MTDPIEPPLVRRDSLGRFQQGNPGGKGRPAGLAILRADCLEYSGKCFAALLKVVEDPESRTADKIRACEVFLTFCVPKPLAEAIPSRPEVNSMLKEALTPKSTHPEPILSTTGLPRLL